MTNEENLMEVVNFLRLGLDRSTLSQIILPLNSQIQKSNEILPVALLSGNINLRASFKKEGKLVPFEEELERLELTISKLKLSQRTTTDASPQIFNLSTEMKKLSIESTNVLDEKEVEIKEEWTEEDEIILRHRTVDRRRPTFPSSLTEREQFNSQLAHQKMKLSNDLEEILRLAELQESEETEFVLKSKVLEIKQELKNENAKITGRNQVKQFPELNLPKIDAKTSSSFVGIVGEIVEHVSEVPVRIDCDRKMVPDSVSSRIILNDLKKMKMNLDVEMAEDVEDQVQSETLKKSSRFSLRNQAK